MKNEQDKGVIKNLKYGLVVAALVGTLTLYINSEVIIDNTASRKGILILAPQLGMNLEYRHVNDERKVFIWLRVLDAYYTNTVFIN